MKLYRVKFVTKVGGWRSWVIDIEANTAKEARAKTEQMWYEHSKAHVFNIEVRLLKDTEEFLYNYFAERARGE